MVQEDALSIPMNPLLTLFEITGDPHGDPEHAISSSIRFGPHTQEVLCPGCRRPGIEARIDWNAVVDLIGEDAKYFPDVIGGLHQKLISHKAYTSLHNAGCKGFVARPVSIDSVESPLLQRQPFPPYYLLEITGRVDIDRQLFDEGEGTVCEACHNWTPMKGGKHSYGDKVKVPLLDTWDGADLVMVRNIKSAYVYCSLKVVNLAIRDQWTDFGIRAFTPRLTCPDLRKPDWLDDLAAAVAAKFPDL